MNLQEQILRIQEMMFINEDNVNDRFYKLDSKLVEIFKKIEKDYGETLTIKSGFRDKETNEKMGGASNSAHLRGLAIDIKFNTPNREGIKKLITLATKHGILGIGVYRDAKDLHIDIDESLGRRSWGPDYSPNTIPQWAKNEVSKHLKNQK